MARDTIDYSHGDSGNKPPDGNEFAAGERPDAQYFDWYINEFVVSINNVWSEFDRLDADDDGVVDRADYADDADASTYKGNDIDADGNGVVDEAELANDASALEGNTLSQVRAHTPDAHASTHHDGGADELDGADLAGADGASGQVLTTDGSTATWSENFEGHTYTDGAGRTMVKVGENRFGAEGTTTTATSPNTIAASDLVFNPDDYKDANGDLYIRVIYHLKHAVDGGTAYARLYRQDAASPVDGSNANVEDTQASVSVTDRWEHADTGWVELSGDSGFESYQIQLWTSDDQEVAYNSITIWFGQPA